jgi:hypothetical protein
MQSITQFRTTSGIAHPSLVRARGGITWPRLLASRRITLDQRGEYTSRGVLILLVEQEHANIFIGGCRHVLPIHNVEEGLEL